MRKLKGRDLFPFMRLIRDLDLKKEISSIKYDDLKLKSQFEVGIEVIFTIFEKVSEKNSEAMLFEFLGGPFEMDAESVADLDFEIICDHLINEIGIGSLVSFFKTATRAMS